MRAIRKKPVVTNVRNSARNFSELQTSEQQINYRYVLAAFIGHIPLAILMSRFGFIATLHALVTIVGGFWIAFSAKKIEKVAYVAAYITGAEVLWRMTGADFFWEGAKYGVSAIFVIAMIRHGRLRLNALTVAYFVLLLPSIAFTLQAVPLSTAQGLLSGNMSGPLALMVAGCFFTQITFSHDKLYRFFLSLIAPCLGVAVVAVFGIATADEIAFNGESNFQSSGGFGPNQVSSALGLGALCCFLIILNKEVQLKLKILVGGAMLFLVAQSALTFSRGGLYNLIGAIVFASVFLLKDSRTRLQFALASVLIFSFSYFVIFPRLNSFTGGALSERFNDTDLTGRGDIASADVQIWMNNLALGVGPGIAKQYRGEFGRTASAHTEFTRLLSEHGMLGLAALFLIGLAAVRNVIAARGARERALVVAVTAWSFFFMFNTAMRIVAPSLLFGLGFACFTPLRVGRHRASQNALARPSNINLRRSTVPSGRYLHSRHS